MNSRKTKRLLLIVALLIALIGGAFASVILLNKTNIDVVSLENNEIIVEEKTVEETNTEEEVIGSWEDAKDGSITNELKDLFTRALDGYTGMKLEPIELLSTQTVSGKNYKFLCNATTISPNSKVTKKIVTIYEDLKGNVSIIDIEDYIDPNQNNVETMSFWVTFFNPDGVALQRTQEKYGTTPKYVGEEPTYWDSDYWYKFICWTDKVGNEIIDFKPITTNTYFYAKYEIGGSNKNSDSFINIVPSKGSIITIGKDDKAEDFVIVRNLGNNLALVMAVNPASIMSFKDDSFDPKTYEDSNIDTWLNDGYYTSEIENHPELENAILSSNIVLDSWENVDIDYDYSFSGQGVSKGDNISNIERKIYILSLQDIVDFCDASPDVPVSKEQILKLFAYENEEIWLRSISNNVEKDAMYLETTNGQTQEGICNEQRNIYPAFVVDLTKIEFTKGTFDVTLSVNNTDYGDAEGAGEYEKDSEVTVKALPNPGYKFIKWTNTSDETVSTDAEYTFIVTRDISLIANFEYYMPDDGDVIKLNSDNYLYTVSNKEGNVVDLTPTIPESGTSKTGYTLTPDSFVLQRHITLDKDTVTSDYSDDGSVYIYEDGEDTGITSGYFDVGGDLTIKAVPDEHRNFVKWSDGTSEYTEASKEITLSSDVTYTATFDIDKILIKTAVNSSDMGGVSINDDATITEKSFDYNDDVKLTALSKQGYRFVKWSDGTSDYTDNPLTFKADDAKNNITYTATFESFTMPQKSSIISIEDKDYLVLNTSGNFAYLLARDNYKNTKFNNSSMSYTFNGLSSAEFTVQGYFGSTLDTLLNSDYKDDGITSFYESLSSKTQFAIVAASKDKWDNFGECKYDLWSNSDSLPFTYTFKYGINDQNTKTMSLYAKYNYDTVARKVSALSISEIIDYLGKENLGGSKILEMFNINDSSKVWLRSAQYDSSAYVWVIDGSDGQIKPISYNTSTVGARPAFIIDLSEVNFTPKLLVKGVSENSSYGTVSGSGYHKINDDIDKAKLTATPKQGYKFIEWTKDGASCGNDNPYEFKVTEDNAGTYTAVFKEIHIPTKGETISIDNKDYLVLKVGDSNNEVTLLARDSFGTSKFNDSTNNTYENSTLDILMNSYYESLDEKVRDAIVEKDITLDSYSTDESGDTVYHQTVGPTTDLQNYSISRHNSESTSTIKRKVYAISVDDIIEYLGSNNLYGNNVNKMFNLTKNIKDNSNYAWTRSKRYNNTGSARIIYGYNGSMDSYSCVNDGLQVYPEFVIDFSLLDATYIEGKAAKLSGVDVGSVTGSGYLLNKTGKKLELEASGHVGYKLDKWDDDNTDNPRIFTGGSLTDTIITKTASFTTFKMPEKTNVIAIDGNDYYVMKVEGNEAFLLSKQPYTTSAYNTSSQTWVNPSGFEKYDGSILDKLLNETYLNSLSFKDAVVSKTIDCDFWGLNTGGNPHYSPTKGSTDPEITYDISKATVTRQIERKVYALGVQDLFDYFGENNVTGAKLDELFGFSKGTKHTDNRTWLRSVRAENSHKESPIIVDGETGAIDSWSNLNAPLQVFPSMSVDLSRIDFVVMPNKGETISLYGNQYLVLKTSGSEATLLARDSYCDTKFNDTNSNAYENSVLDKVLNSENPTDGITSYYESLDSRIKNMIVEKEIVLDSYYQNSASGNPDYTQHYGESNDSQHSRTISRYAAGSSTIQRKVYAISVDDIIEYLGPNNLYGEKYREMFGLQRGVGQSDKSNMAWTRTARAGMSSVRIIFGYQQVIDSFSANTDGIKAYPEFVVDYSLKE